MALPFSFALPGALLLLGLALPLILLYRSQSQETELEVGSIFLLKKLSRRPVPAKTVKLPLRFWLELLALALLSLAAANLSLSAGSRQLALILDSSLSMQARSETAASADTRLVAAKAALKKEIDNHTNAQFTVFSAAAELKRLNAEAVGAASAKKLLEQIPAEPSADKLLQNLSGFENWCEFDEVFLATDYPQQQDDSSTDDNQPGPALRAKTLGRPVANLLLESAALEPEQLKGSLRNFSALPAPAELLVKAQSGEILAEKQLTVGAESSRNFSIPLSLTNEVPATVEIFAPAARDALAADNRLVLNARQKVQKPRLALIGMRFGGTPNTSGLQTLKTISVAEFSPAAFSALTKNERNAFELVVLDAWLPEKLPQSPAVLFVLPPDGTGLFTRPQVTNSAVLTSIDESHPLAAYLQASSLQIKDALIFDSPEWATAVLKTKTGALLFAGEVGGRRMAVSGLALLPFEGRNAPASTVLTLNLLSWLLNTENMAGNFALASESNTFSPEKLSLPNKLSCKQSAASGAKQALWRWLLLFALVVLVVEFLLWIFQRGRRD